MTTIAGPAGQLNVDDGGTGGLPVLLVHSFAGSCAHWKAQLAHLRRRRRALAMDLRGHGRSDKPPAGDYGVSALAEDIAAVADSLELRRFVLVGHSMGGAAAAAYAGKHPAKLAGLVLAGTPGKSSGEQAQKIMSALRADYDKVMAGYWNSLLEGAGASVRELLETGMRSVGREASLAMIGAIFEYDPLPDLRSYSGPKLIIDTPHGDGPTALHRQMPDVSRKVIDGTSHWPHLDKPQEFNRLLDEFLAWLA
ncbi:MAG TPA: alpha/beta hydrolase [Ramlibacter sp.]|nr:alpha/beta hydrolase [Ramlibacter sp.]